MSEKERNTTFYIGIDDEHCIPLGSISQVSLEDEQIDDMEYENFDIGGEMVIEIKPPQNYRELKRFIELVHPSLSWVGWWTSRYGNNNWRKLHGLPMIRRKVGIERV